jgi:outer membrane PBP1 activator LpoA protein
MKKWIVLIVLAATLAGCSGIIADARHSALIDTTAAVSRTVYERSLKADECDTCVGEWTRDEVRQLLKDNAEIWLYFQQAKSGQGTFPMDEVN